MNLTFDLYELNTITILVRILLAVLIGGLIGMERGMKNHTAGTNLYSRLSWFYHGHDDKPIRY